MGGRPVTDSNSNIETFFTFVRILSTRILIFCLFLTASYFCSWSIQWIYKNYSEFAIAREETVSPIGSDVFLYTVAGLPVLIILGMIGIIIADVIDRSWRAAVEESK
jgi:hypothetical protein